MPHVITGGGKDGHELEIPYEEGDNINAGSIDAEDLKKALHAGVAPEAYGDAITDIEAKVVRRKASGEAEAKEPDKTGSAKGKCHFERRKVVRFFLKPDRNNHFSYGTEKSKETRMLL